MNAQILIIKPRSLTVADKKLLRENGVVCIEAADPSSVRLITAEGQALSGNDLFLCAMNAIAADRYTGNTGEKFAQAVAALCKASVESKP